MLSLLDRAFVSAEETKNKTCGKEIGIDPLQSLFSSRQYGFSIVSTFNKFLFVAGPTHC